MAKEISSRDREAAILRYVHLNSGAEGRPSGVTVREIWSALRDPVELGDRVTVQAYHGAVSRLVEQGVLTPLSDEGSARRYVVAEDWRVSLIDIEDGLRREYGSVDDGVFFDPSRTLDPSAYAEYLDGQLTFRERGIEVLRLAVRGLLQEEPVDLVLRMFRGRVEDFNALVERYRDLEDGEARVRSRFRELRLLVHSYYGLSVLDFPTGTAVDALKGRNIKPDWTAVEQALRHRVFGEGVLNWLDVGRAKDDAGRPFVTAGSDGSSHSKNVSGFPGSGVQDDDAGLVLTFNNALAALDLPDNLASHFDYPYHSVPLNRAAFEDPENFAMVMARIWFDDLTDAGYEHLKQAALELVQCQVDQRVVLGVANVLGDGPVLGRGRRMVLPRPAVHFRDGLVTPQVRELMWGNYCEDSVAGEMYRKIMALWWSMLQSVSGSERQVLGGVVKSTQMRAFSELVNWYVARGSAGRSIPGKVYEDAIASDWSGAAFSRLSDHQVMTQLMAAADLELDAGEQMKAGKYLCSFAIMRPFPQLDSDLRYLTVRDDDWVGYFEALRANGVKNRLEYGGDPHYLETVTVSDEPYVQMCRKADYVSFYVGHTAGDPAPQLPRYEFVDSLRPLNDEGLMKSRIASRVRLVVEALHDGGFAQDWDHSFMLDKPIVRLLPFVVYDAHEKSKVWGNRLSTEFRAAVFERLAEMRSGGGVGGQRDLVFESIPAAEYIKRVAKALGPSGMAEQLQLL